MALWVYLDTLTCTLLRVPYCLQAVTAAAAALLLCILPLPCQAENEFAGYDHYADDVMMPEDAMMADYLESLASQQLLGEVLFAAMPKCFTAETECILYHSSHEDLLRYLDVSAVICEKPRHS